jgi:SAM-dependent methyltransferase
MPRRNAAGASTAMPSALDLRRLASAVKRRLAPAAPVPQSAAPAQPLVDFVCNICGHANTGVPREQMQNREGQSCRSCASSLRMRSVMYALSTELFGRAVVLRDFPVDKSIAGIGMSDWEGYATALREKLDYTNTYYHAEPRLDITRIPDEAVGRYRFLLSSDVFEHIPGFALDDAFRNACRLLHDGGVFIFTVPFLKSGETQEHFPRLHDFRIVETRGKRFLYNRTADGVEEIFDDLVFHGGEGMTLEMRMFTEPDLLRRLREAGFSSAQVRIDYAPEYGIHWPIDYAVPIVARRGGTGDRA